jgi:hypothetical protein
MSHQRRARSIVPTPGIADRRPGLATTHRPRRVMTETIPIKKKERFAAWFRCIHQSGEPTMSIIDATDRFPGDQKRSRRWVPARPDDLTDLARTRAEAGLASATIGQLKKGLCWGSVVSSIDGARGDMRDQEIRAALDRHWAASDANDFEAEHCIYREDAVLEYPQSPSGPPRSVPSGRRCPPRPPGRCLRISLCALSTPTWFL